MTKRYLKILIILLLLTPMIPPPEAKAMDPVTISLLAPIALQLAEKASPYIIKGGANLFNCLWDMGGDVIDLFFLPIGLGQMTIGAPFGAFRDGFFNMIRGGIAPGKLAIRALLLPLVICGLNLNM